MNQFYILAIEFTEKMSGIVSLEENCDNKSHGLDWQIHQNNFKQWSTKTPVTFLPVYLDIGHLFLYDT